MARNKAKPPRAEEAAAVKATPNKPTTSPWRRVRENAEAVIIAIILALIIRHYSLEAFEIPTGSMAPGLHGVHVEATCPNCSTTTQVGLVTDPHNGAPRINPRPGYLYDGPCAECGLHIRDSVGGSDTPVRCPRCDDTHRGSEEHYRRSKSGIDQVRVWCPECTYEYAHYFEPKDIQGGHKILVNKFSYELDDPERWEVIVFKFNRQRNYIKRCVGLPGEQIQVVSGDIHIDGEIERKPLGAQNDMWVPIHDTAIPEVGLIDPAWESRGSFRPRPEQGDLEFNALDGLASLHYSRAVRNISAYNAVRRALTGTDTVRDLRALIDVKVEGRDAEASPRFWVDIRNAGIVYRLSLPIGAGILEVLRLPAELAGEEWLPESMREEQGRLTAPGQWTAAARVEKGTGLEVGRRHLVDFSVVDRQVRVSIDGELLVEQPVDPRDLGAGQSRRNASHNGEVTIRARHCGGKVDRIRLYRDIHYTSRGSGLGYALDRPYQIHEEGFFAMGDNSSSSLDSRAWGALSRQNLLGRGFAIFWPALPGRFDLGFIH